MVISSNTKLLIECVANDKNNVVIQKAQSELKEYFKLMFKPNNSQDENTLRVKLVVEKNDKLDFDGFSVEVKKDEIVIQSAIERGVLYGVYALLKKMGCFFIFPKKSEEIVPSYGSYNLEEFSLLENPLIEYRGMCLYQTMGDTLQESLEAIDYMGKNYYNFLLTSLEREDDTSGNAHAIMYLEIKEQYLPAIKERGIVIDMSEHSTDYFFSRDELFEKHPEWFALLDGKRTKGQICYSNEDAVKTYVDAFVEYVKNNNEFEFMGTWPLDGGGYCQCEQCQDPYLLYRVNKRIAAAVKQVRPELIVEHLAYTPQSFSRPSEALPSNMSVLVCSVKDQVAYEWGQRAENSGGAFYFDYCTGDHYRYRGNVILNPFYSNNMVNNFATYRYRGIVSLVLPITAWWQSGINYSLLSQSYYNPMVSVKEQIEHLCLGLYGNTNGSIMAKAMYKTANELHSKLLWSGHPHKHSYMPHHSDYRTAVVDEMHAKQFNKVYNEIFALLKTVDESCFTSKQKKQFDYFVAYLELQHIYFMDIDQFNANTQNEKNATRYLEKLVELNEKFGPVFISEGYARWRIIGRDNILKPTNEPNQYEDQI